MKVDNNLFKSLSVLISFMYAKYSIIPLQFGEFAEYAHKVKLTKDTARLEEAVAFHNGVTQWTICNIMKEFTAARRADVIVKFIDVAQVCSL